MGSQDRASRRETFTFLIHAASAGTRLAVHSRLQAGMDPEAIRDELLGRMRSEFADKREALLNASLIAAVHCTLGEMLN